jgi:hypothetical protein
MTTIYVYADTSSVPERGVSCCWATLAAAVLALLLSPAMLPPGTPTLLSLSPLSPLSLPLSALSPQPQATEPPGYY